MKKMMPVYGVDVAKHTQCAHYYSELDTIAILFKCCQRYFACYQCHQAIADHVAERWKIDEYNTHAILCGGCGNEMTIADYLSCGSACPQCRISFNPGCKKHYSLYFEY